MIEHEKNKFNENIQYLVNLINFHSCLVVQLFDAYLGRKRIKNTLEFRSVLHFLKHYQAENSNEKTFVFHCHVIILRVHGTVSAFLIPVPLIYCRTFRPPPRHATHSIDFFLLARVPAICNVDIPLATCSLSFRMCSSMTQSDRTKPISGYSNVRLQQNWRDAPPPGAEIPDFR